jgi:hypothetical protein
LKDKAPNRGVQALVFEAYRHDPVRSCETRVIHEERYTIERRALVVPLAAADVLQELRRLAANKVIMTSASGDYMTSAIEYGSDHALR